MSLNLKELPREEWDEYLDRFPDATPFHTRDWLECLEEVRGANWIPLGMFRGGKLVGLAPIFSLTRGFLKLLASPLTGWATPYLGPLCGEGELEDALRALKCKASECRAAYLELTLTPGKEVGDLGFRKEMRTTYILDLEPDEGVMWKKLKKECRNRVRKAEKEGVQVHEVPSPEFFRTYWEMAKDVYAKSRRPPAIPLEFFVRLWDRLRPKGRIRVLVAEHKGEPIASLISLIHRDTVYDWDGVSYLKAYKLAANNLLEWEIIRWASREGFRRYDMLGADIPGVARFKASFGPRLEAYPYLFLPLTLPGRLGRTLYKRGAPLVRAVQYWLRKR